MRKSIMHSGLASGVVGGVQFFQGVIFAAALGAAGYGQLALINLWVGFLIAFADFGYNNFFVSNYLPRAKQRKLFYMLTASVVLAATQLLSIVVLEIEDVKLLLALALYVFFFISAQAFFVSYQAQGLLEKVAWAEIVAYVVAFLWVLSVWCFDELSVFTYFSSLALVAIIRCALFYLLHTSEVDESQLLSQRQRFSDYLLKGRAFALSQMAERGANYAGLRAEHFLLAHLLTAEMFGIYIFCWNLVVQPSTKIIPVLNRVYFPVFSKLKGVEQKLKAQELYALVLLCCAPVFVLMGLYSQTLFNVFFDDSWSEAGLILSALCVAYFLRLNFETLTCVNLAQGRAHISLLYTVLSGIINIAVFSLVLLFGGALECAILAASCCIFLLKEFGLHFGVGITFRKMVNVWGVALALLLLSGLAHNFVVALWDIDSSGYMMLAPMVLSTTILFSGLYLAWRFRRRWYA